MMMREVDFLKETVNAQQELLQKLYKELDAERESSSVAADETMSMILRLQGEKAVMEMEASQYKRIAEEKIFHVQDTLDIFQELIYQKDMEIASLEFKVQAYKRKLASLGCDDLSSCENMLSIRNNSLVGEKYKRWNSLPPPLNNALSRRASTEGAKTETPSPREEPTLRRVSTTKGECDSYWEEIEKLDQRVKGFNGLSSLNGFLGLECSTSSSRDVSPDDSLDKLDFHEYSENRLKVEIGGESQCSTSVQDIFEVPQCSHKEQKPELCLDRDSDRSSPDSNDLEEKIDEITEPKNLIKHPRYGVANFELRDLNRRLKQLEGKRLVVRDCEEAEDEGLKLLREIMEKVEAVESELTRRRTNKKAEPPENRSFGCFTIKEVMLCFLPKSDA